MKRSHALAAAVLPPLATLVPASVASARPTAATEDPTPVDIETNEGPMDGPMEGVQGRSGGWCGTWTTSHKHSTTLLFMTVDVFKHRARSGACTNRAVMTDIYRDLNECQKYAWGVAYFTRTNAYHGPVGQKTAFEQMECAVSIGGEIGGVGVKITRQSNIRHTYSLQSSGEVWVHAEQWETMP